MVYTLDGDENDAKDQDTESAQGGVGGGNALSAIEAADAARGGRGTTNTLLASAEALLRLVEARDALQGSIYSPIGGKILPAPGIMNQVHPQACIGVHFRKSCFTLRQMRCGPPRMWSISENHTHDNPCL